MGVFPCVAQHGPERDDDEEDAIGKAAEDLDSAVAKREHARGLSRSTSSRRTRERKELYIAISRRPTLLLPLPPPHTHTQTQTSPSKTNLPLGHDRGVEADHESWGERSRRAWQVGGGAVESGKLGGDVHVHIATITEQSCGASVGDEDQRIKMEGGKCWDNRTHRCSRRTCGRRR